MTAHSDAGARQLVTADHAPVYENRKAGPTRPRTKFSDVAHRLLWAYGVGILSGLVAGVIVLGISGRIAMRVVALAGGVEPRLSIWGTLAVVAALGLLGTPLGLLFVALRKYLPRDSLWAGAAFGVVSFVLMAGLVMVRRGGAGELALHPFTASALFGGLFVINGLALSVAKAWIEQWLPTPSRRVGSIIGQGFLLLIGAFGLVMWAAFVFDPGE